AGAHACRVKCQARSAAAAALSSTVRPLNVHKLSAKAIIIGGVVDVLSSMVLGGFLTAYVMARRGVHSTNSSALHTSVINAINQSWVLHGTQFLIGYGCSVLGGYVAAWLARQSHVLNGALASWLCVGIGIYSLVSPSAVQTPLFTVLSIVATPFCYVL